MNLHIAGCYMINFMPGQQAHLKLDPHEQTVVAAAPHHLDSYFYIQRGDAVEALRRLGRTTFLDSGAFSAFTVGRPVNIDDYIRFIYDNYDIIEKAEGIPMYSVLDHIGEAAGTWENQAYMERKGLKPMPCFHAGEPFGYLEWYVQHYEYISLGGMVGASTEALTRWLDTVWDRYLLDGAGRPRIRVHGFGITSIPLMQRYPWYSVDSSSWAQTARYGSILMPEGLGQIEVSNRSPAKHDLGKHLFSMSPQEREFIASKITSQGFDLDRIVSYFYSRAAYCIWSYNVIANEIDAVRPDRVAIRPQELF